MPIVPILQHPAVVKWLGGIEPVWTMLDHGAFAALRHPDATIYGPIQLATDLTSDEIQQSAFARNALLLLRSAATGPGLKLTATGNLSRAVVADMCDCTDWPGYDKAEMLKFCKVVNEPDYYPLFFLRHVLQAAKLLRRSKGHLKITTSGQKLLHDPGSGVLAAVLFHVTFWRLDLGYRTRNLLAGWPQSDIGILLWSLSVAAHDWQPGERLTRLCTIPVNSLFERTWDIGSSVLEGDILQPLVWFGLLEFRGAERQPGHMVERRSFRKTPLFDGLVSFDIALSAPADPRH
jgi:hypothetical protein